MKKKSKKTKSNKTQVDAQNANQPGLIHDHAGSEVDHTGEEDLSKVKPTSSFSLPNLR